MALNTDNDTVDGMGPVLVRSSTALLVLNHNCQQVLVPVQREKKNEKSKGKEEGRKCWQTKRGPEMTNLFRDSLRALSLLPLGMHVYTYFHACAVGL